MGRFDKILSHEQNENNSKNIFVFIEGEYQGGTFECSGNAEISLGRDLTCDVVLIDNNVSRNHASIFCKNGKTFVKDLGSTNGTKLNGENIIAKEDFELYAGDIITMGESVFRYGKDDLSIFNDTADIDINLEDNPPKEPEKNKNIASIADKLLNEVELSISEDLAVTSKTEVKVPTNLASGNLKDTSGGILTDKIVKLGVSGLLRISLDAPFNEKIKIDFSTNGVASAESLTHPAYSPAKIFSRFLLSTEGKFSFSRNGENNKKKSPELMELLAQANIELKMIQKYREIITFNKLLIKKPLIAKLTLLSKADLETFQFMINAESVIKYLDSFKDFDELLLLDQIDKMMTRTYLESPETNNSFELEDILDI